MKNKGFTLTEMLGVMTLLVVIFAVIYPNVMNMMEEGKESEYEEYLNNVYLATEAYANAYTSVSSTLNLPGDSATVTFSDLLTSGYLSTKLVDPKSGETVVTNAGNKKVIITVAKDKTFTYSME